MVIKSELASLTIKDRGTIYTPKWLAEILAQIATQNENTAILDPSYGKCALLIECMRELRRRGVQKAGRHLFGVDYDSSTRSYLSPLLNAGAMEHQFVNKDFLKTSLDDLGGVLFSTVVANPPFTRRNALQPSETETIDHLIESKGLKWMKSAGYWTYFLLHASELLQKHGDLVFIVPSSILESEYGKLVLRYLRKNFEGIRVMMLTFAPFPDALVSIGVLFAKDFGLSDGYLSIGVANDPKTLLDAIRQKSIGRGPWSDEDSSAWKMMLLSEEIRRPYDTILQNSSVRRMRDVINVRIGLVTGANDFFVLNKRKATELKLQDNQTFPIISHGHSTRGLTFNANDYDKIVSDCEPSKLLALNGEFLSDSLREYVKDGESKKLNMRLKCRLRETWYELDDLTIPDAFFQYMKSCGPHLVLNYSRCSSTNALHRVEFKKEVSPAQRRLIALSLMTSFSQLSFELLGRSYGGGVLKIEPGTLRRIPYVDCDLSRNIEFVFDACDEHLRNGNVDEAIRVADKLVLVDSGIVTRVQAKTLFEGWRSLVSIRNGHPFPESRVLAATKR